MKPHYLILFAVVVLYAEACLADLPYLYTHHMQPKPRQPNPSNKNSQSYLQSRKLNIQSQRAYSSSNIDNRYWDPNYNPNIPPPHIEITVDDSDYEAQSDENSQPGNDDVLISSSDYLDTSEQEMKAENSAGDRQREVDLSFRVTFESTKPGQVVHYG